VPVSESCDPVATFLSSGVGISGQRTHDLHNVFGSEGTPEGRLESEEFGCHKTVLGTTNYLYDGDNLIEERDTAANILARYTQRLGIDQPLAEVRSGIASYYEQDALGSVTSLSNSVSSLANTYIFESFGKLTTSTGTLTNPFQYTGRDFDPETGLRFYRARFYDPLSGRFLSEDPIRFRGGINFYGYTGNSAVNGTDPSGLWSPAAHDQIIWNALHGCIGVSDADIYQIQRGSRWFDENFQGPNWSPGHAMSNGNANQSGQQARNITAALVAGEMNAATNAMNAGARNQALFTFGIAMHPLMDMTSPAHTDAQGNPIPWCGLAGCGGLSGLEQVNQHSAYDITGIERVQDLTVPVQELNSFMIRNWYQALTGRQLDCGGCH